MNNPEQGAALKSAHEVREALERDKHLIAGEDVARSFDKELQTFEQAVSRSLDESHALLNGKWIVGHLAASRTRLPERQCRDRWIEHARSRGGLQEVRQFWQRVFPKGR